MAHPLVAKRHGPQLSSIALFSCALAVFSVQGGASELSLSEQNALSTQEALFAQDRLKATREHWLRSKFEFSGRTNDDSDRLDGTLNLGLKNMFGESHRADLRYADSKTYRVSNERKVLGFGYGLPVGRNQLRMELTNTAYDEVSRVEGARYQKAGRIRDVAVTGSRPLFSVSGYSIRGRAGYNSLTRSWTRQSDENHRNHYEVSTLGFEALGRHDLVGGFSLSSGFRAVTGIETEAERTAVGYQDSQDDQFGRMLFTASLDREMLDWQWDLEGQYQIASADIPGSHRLQVAGSALSTGFSGQSLSVAEGGWLRLGSRSPTFNVPFFPQMLSSVRLSVLRGWVPDVSFQQDQSGHVTSGELSLGLTARKFSADVSVGRVLGTTTEAIVVPDHPDVRLSMSLKI
ncbi:ShlB/FhaC/HecB family hemolysin secretion/activation protein [Marinobacter excellens]|jgi:hemolysin activation/secretion protein|uniref:Hemolysin activation/secretion protein-like n=1 Tax=Marinobacter excellens LAMA 842 TaxID=1306954 RepID=A0A137SH31_9GAMM|nr:ShlB/FhaC/HecB family hemolysin secretion/activation protein [Marinobacter excellens]KXO11746.1 Hemolysin activation/secretion protein-like [Marinobacter excellens LAMA 842]